MLCSRIVTEALVDWEPNAGARPGLLPASSISRREAVVNQIRRGIVLGVLRPGEKLTEVALATALQVSRPTVREALAQLAQEGLLTVEPYRGLRVTEIDAAAIRDLAQTRMALDRLAIRAIMNDATGRRMAALLQAWHAYEATVDDPDPVARHDAHLAFHRAIWSASENVLLEQLWPVIEAHMTIALAEDQRARPNPERSRRIHAALVDSIVARDVDRVEAALQAHTVATAEELIAICHRPDHPQDEPVSALSERGHDVVGASRSSLPAVDATNPTSIAALFASVGALDAVVAAVGSAPYEPLAELDHDDFLKGLLAKALAQIDIVQLGTPYVTDGGSFTLTTGVLGREPIVTGAASSVANGALDAFTMAAAIELPRGIRINTVSPTVLLEATSHHGAFPGFTQVSAAAVGQAYVKAVEGAHTGKVYALDGQ